MTDSERQSVTAGILIISVDLKRLQRPRVIKQPYYI
jgi:hypothetical protein